MATAVRQYHKWKPEEKAVLHACTEEQVHKLAERMGLPFTAVYAQWRLMREDADKTTEMAHFDYSKLVPLKALFVRCPVCGGTTTVNKWAYCRSCLSQWHPITLQPIEGLHASDPW